MADENKKRKEWSKMSFRELDRQALVEHALSLGGTTSLEALDYLEELAEVFPVTDEVKAAKKRELQDKKKRVKDTDGNLIETNKPLYTEKQIEKMLDEMKGTPKYSIFEIKQRYCEKYYPAILENKKKSEVSFADMIAAAKAKAKAAI